MRSFDELNGLAELPRRQRDHRLRRASLIQLLRLTHGLRQPHGLREVVIDPVEVATNHARDQAAEPPIEDSLAVTRGLGDLDQFVRERDALVDGVRRNDRGSAAVHCVDERLAAAGCAGEVERLPAQPVAAVAHPVVTERSGQARHQPHPKLHVLVRDHDERLLEQRNECGVARCTREHAPAAVADRRAGKLPAEPVCAGELGRGEERLLRRRPRSRPLIGLPERQQQLAALAVIARAHSVERGERHTVQA